MCEQSATGCKEKFGGRGLGLAEARHQFVDTRCGWLFDVLQVQEPGAGFGWPCTQREAGSLRGVAARCYTLTAADPAVTGLEILATQACCQLPLAEIEQTFERTLLFSGIESGHGFAPHIEIIGIKLGYSRNNLDNAADGLVTVQGRWRAPDNFDALDRHSWHQ